MTFRSVLGGVAPGATLAIGGVLIADIWLKDQPKPLYLRIADDNFDHILGPDYRAEDGPMSARLIRHCGIDRFTTISALPDYAGSSLVPLASTPEAKINCLIGEARIHALSLAVAPGPDTANFECLPGWPSRFQPFNAADYELCRGHKPDATFGSTQKVE